MRHCPGALLAAALTIFAWGCGAADEDPARTPSPTVQEPATCMPRPSACGFPDATNTGVPAGTELTRVDGTVVLDRPGEVYSGKEVHGEIHVEADDVTIEKVRVISGAYYPIRTFGPGNPTGTVIRDVEIDMQGMDEAKGIAFNDYTATRVWFHNGLDCAHAGTNVVITDSFCDLPKLPPDSEAHADGFQSDGGRNLVFRHNTVRNPNGQTAAILMSTNTAPIDGVVIDNNLLSGGGYTVYCGTSEGGVATRLTYTNNVISREFFPKGGYYGPATECGRVDVARGNRFDGGAAVAGGLGGGSAGREARQLGSARAKRIVKAALGRELGRRYERRARLRLRCDRRSRSVVACAVKWRRAVDGRTQQRYSGKVVVRETPDGRRRYRLRVREWSRGCGCSRVIRRERSALAGVRIATNDLTSGPIFSGSSCASGNSRRSSRPRIRRISRTCSRAVSGSGHGPRQPQRRRRSSATRTATGSQCHAGVRKCGSTGNQKFGVWTQ